MTIQRTHLKVSRDGPEAAAFKSVDSNDSTEAFFSGVSSTYVWKGIERYIEGFDLWAASFYIDELDEAVQYLTSEQDICALISTGIAVDPAQCENVGGQNIRIGVDPLFPVDGHPFIFALTDADVALPTDFSVAPPPDFPFLPKP